MRDRIRIVYVISNIEKALSFEWINNCLDKNKFELSFILIGQSHTTLEHQLKKNNPKVFHIAYCNKKDLPSAFVKVVKHLIRLKAQVVHTHLFEASLIGLTAAWLLRIRKRIRTRHHAMVHYHEFPQGRKWDKWCNHIATHIIAPSETIREILIEKDKAEAAKIHLVHHGFDLDYFADVPAANVQELKNKYGIPDNAFPVIGVIARYVSWKGIHHIIPAFIEIRRTWPNAHLVLANADGDFQAEIRKLLTALKPESFTEIKFENNLAPLYKMLQVYVHIPTDRLSEAFGQTYVEALAAGIPSVFTLSGIANEFIKHRENALLVSYENSAEVYKAIVEILENEALRKTLIQNGLKSVQEKFSLKLMINNLSQIYDPSFRDIRV
jgi:glycosyltransferase involved in cell wall biosynthesis